MRILLPVALACLLVPAGRLPASAQTDAPVEPADLARFRLGPLRFTPSISLTNLGVDDNVFNDTANPKQDTTGAIGPAVDLWLRAGRSRLAGHVSGQYLYFNEYRSQRAFNTDDNARWEVPLARLTPFAAGAYVNTKDRPGFEIDSRARQSTRSATLGADLRLSGKTNVVLTGTRSLTAFDDSQTFLGADLANALNHTADTEQVQLRYKLTPLTTFVVSADAIQDRFSLNPLRSSNSIRVLPGFELQPSALVSGRIFVGYRRFEPLDPRVPAYQGVNASVTAKYTAGATQFDVKANRDVAYSYQAVQPYYTLTDLGLAVTERLTYTWDVVARGGRQTLDYQAVQTALVTDPQVDTIRQFGGGIGYRFGRIMRLGFDVNYYRRTSTSISSSEYKGLRFGGSVTYGLPQ